MTTAPRDHDLELLALDALGGRVADDRAAEPLVVPAALRSRLVAGALDGRADRRPVPAVEVIDAAEAYRRTVEELFVVTDGLAGDDWLRPCRHDLRVIDLVAHLIGVEDYVLSQLGRSDGTWLAPGAELDHVALTAPAVLAHRAAAPGLVRTRLEHAVGTTLAAVRAEPELMDRAARWHAAPVTVRDLLTIRTFEVWTHTDDVRRAVEAPVAAPDAARLALMTDLAMRLLPAAMTLAGRERPAVTARIVLTGPGGGTWVTPLDLGGSAGPGATEDVVLVADRIDFCRVAARRLAPDQLAHDVEGDPSLAADILHGAAALAAD